MITFDKLQELISLLDAAPDVTELTICVQGGEQVTIKKPGRSLTPVQPQQLVEPTEIPDDRIPADDATIESAHPVSQESKPSRNLITADRVGIFHTSKPRIEAGDKIVNGQIVGFIESIKIMNEIRSSINGTLAEQLIEDGSPVEYGHQLYTLDSD